MRRARRGRQSVGWWEALVVALALVGSLACAWPFTKTKPPDQLPPVQAEDPQAQAGFDEALEALRAGDYERARAGFAQVRSEFAGDAIAPVAEMYAARSLLERVRFGPAGGLASTAPSGQVDRAVTGLEALTKQRKLEGQVRWAARVYLAIARAVSGRGEDALVALEEYPGASLGSAVLGSDRPAAWLLLTEAMWRQERYEEVLVASAMLQDRVLAGIDEAEQAPSADEQRAAEVLTTYARGRGFAAARDHIEEGALQMRFLASDSAFMQAAAGWALLQRRADDELDEQSRAALEDIYQRGAAAMVEIGALERAAEMSSLLATLGQRRRLFIGALVPMSGENRAVGQRVMRGMLLAQEAFEAPQRPRITLVFRDSNQPAEANIEALDELGALAVIGPIQRELADPYAEAARAAELPLILLTTEALSAAQAGEGGEPAPGWVFRNFLTAEAEAHAVAQVAAERWQDRRAAILFPEVGYGRRMAEAFARAFEARGGVVVTRASYDRGATDFSRQARQVARAKPDAIFIPDTGDKVAEVLAFLAREDVWGLPGQERPEAREEKRRYVHYLGTSLWRDPFLVRQAGAYARGATIPSWFVPDAGDEVTREFVGRARAVFGGEPSIYEAFAYDSVRWLHQIILEAGMRRPGSVRDALLAPTPYQGVTGAARLRAWGEPDRQLRFVTITGEGFTPLAFTQPVRARDFLQGPETHDAPPRDEASQEGGDADGATGGAGGAPAPPAAGAGPAPAPPAAPPRQLGE